MKSVGLFVAIFSLAFSTTVFGAGEPNAAKPIVVEHCIKCHAVPG